MHVVSPKPDSIRGWDETDWGDEVTVDVELADARPEDYDGLVLPGRPDQPGQAAPRAAGGRLRARVLRCRQAGRRDLPRSLAAGRGRRRATGRTLTSFASIRTDLKNAGANWVDREVVVDQGLVTSRKPDDLQAFNAKLIEEFAEGRHEAQRRTPDPTQRRREETRGGGLRPTRPPPALRAS